jgi:hypothetical protein
MHYFYMYNIISMPSYSIGVQQAFGRQVFEFKCSCALGRCSLFLRGFDYFVIAGPEYLEIENGMEEEAWGASNYVCRNCVS